METLYLFMLIALAILAMADLIVGVSNDAVNFLNSAIGSKALSFRTIMIIASFGVAAGAVFSSGLMEVARKGIFNPEMFVFSEIMIVFMAVMITDILLLDFFNTFGLPTSTTVSIVFELLGAAVAIALIKIYTGNVNESLVDFINISKATQIIFGILLSVVIAFTIGALVQYISRLFLSFHYKELPKWTGALFGGVALTSITYFILIKGLKGTPFANVTFDFLHGETINQFMASQLMTTIVICLFFWLILSLITVYFIRWDIYKIIIGVGTFSLALAFAGNDLVNFIGVPIAAWQSYKAWVASGVSAETFNMGILSAKVATPTLLLLFAGLIMVLTLWFSTKAKQVVKTTLDLSRQEKTRERFKANAASRSIVRGFISARAAVEKSLPKKYKHIISKQFSPVEIEEIIEKKGDLPAFDNIRASINLTVAAVLISIATSYKLPLSTTYVTFMVAMGTSLADRAWGADSAVYRVAGVLNVIGGWFLTAFIAFTACGVMASLIFVGGIYAILFLLIGAVFILYRNFKRHKVTSELMEREDKLYLIETGSVQSLIVESASNISKMMSRANQIYINNIHGLATQNLDILKKNKKNVRGLTDEIELLRDELFYFIKEIDESNRAASNFYINLISCLENINQSLDYITQASHKHVNNNHKNLKYTQIKELKETQLDLEGLFNEIKFTFDVKEFNQIAHILPVKQQLFENISSKIDHQISRTKKDESSPKNTNLFFSFLIETKDLITATLNLVELYYLQYDSSVKPLNLKDNSSTEEN